MRLYQSSEQRLGRMGNVGGGGTRQDRRLVSESIVAGRRCIAEAKAYVWRPSVTVIRSKESEDVPRLC